MGIFRICRDLAEAERYVGVISDYIDIPRSEDYDYYILDKHLSRWVEENLEGCVTCIFEHQYEKIYNVFLFQYQEDAVAFKLYWL